MDCATQVRVCSFCNSPMSLASTSSSSAWWRPLCVRVSSTAASARDMSTCPIKARAAFWMKRSTCASCTVSSAADASRVAWCPSSAALPGAVSHCASRSAGSCLRISDTSEGTSRNLSRTKVARLRPMRAWLRAMTAVCGMGRPSGRRNSATTANQSASAPTMAASAMAFTALSHRPRSATLVAMNTAVTSNSRPRA